MRRRSSWLIGILVAICALGIGSAYADTVYSQQDNGITLRYKFTPGELLRYNLKMVMNMNMAIAGQTKSMPVTTTAIYRMRTVKVLPNGDAEIRAAVESMKSDMNGSELPLNASSLPVISYIMSPRGDMKSFKMEGDGFGAAGNPFSKMTDLQGMSPTLPEKAIKVGDSWQQDVPFPDMGSSSPITMTGKVKNQFLLTSASAKVASIQQYQSGDFQMKMKTGNAGGNAASAGNMDMKGNLCFSIEKGHLVSCTTSGKTHVDTMVTGANGGHMGMDMQVTMTMTLIQ